MGYLMGHLKHYCLAEKIGGHAKSWTTTLHENIATLFGHIAFGLHRCNQDWKVISSELNQDRWSCVDVISTYTSKIILIDSINRKNNKMFFFIQFALKFAFLYKTHCFYLRLKGPIVRGSSI